MATRNPARTPVEVGRYFPLFTGVGIHPRWLAGFLPSAVTILFIFTPTWGNDAILTNIF